MIRLLALICCLALPATAQMVAEPPGEARVRDLAKTLRCPVCQSESILESRASTAREMMVILREMAEAGKTDAEITAFFRDRYGDFV
ncbi:MAG: cytochrome c-type biogenesis protein CcmH, partial [Alphaproteobacteria bacterium HGW-Alphaproteobacteria-6]